jgi:hypothetical protein
VFQHFVIDFWKWWYQVRVRTEYVRMLAWAGFVLNYTNTLEMARNFTVPMYRDNSGAGKFLSILVRGTWVWFGGMMSVVMIAPAVLWWGLLTILPALSVLMVVIGLLNLIF